MADPLCKIIEELAPERLVEILEELKLEQSVLRDGGYGRSVRTPWKPKLFFRDSPTCPNFGETEKLRPCSEHWLWELVPEKYKDLEFPCHFIPLNEQGDTIASLEAKGPPERLEEVLLGWLGSTIKQLEEELSKRQTAKV